MKSMLRILLSVAPLLLGPLTSYALDLQNNDKVLVVDIMQRACEADVAAVSGELIKLRMPPTPYGSFSCTVKSGWQSASGADIEKLTPVDKAEYGWFYPKTLYVGQTVLIASSWTPLCEARVTAISGNYVKISAEADEVSDSFNLPTLCTGTSMYWWHQKYIRPL